jgi:hypothetical protein
VVVEANIKAQSPVTFVEDRISGLHVLLVEVMQVPEWRPLGKG